jgi:hypothetical protein
MSEPVFWALALAALTAAGSTSFMRRIGKPRLISLLTVWAGSVASILLLYGTIPAVLTASVTGTAGGLLLIISLIRSGISSMPNQRYEERKKAG